MTSRQAPGLPHDPMRMKMWPTIGCEFILPSSWMLESQVVHSKGRLIEFGTKPGRRGFRNEVARSVICYYLPRNMISRGGLSRQWPLVASHSKSSLSSAPISTVTLRATKRAFETGPDIAMQVEAMRHLAYYTPYLSEYRRGMNPTLYLSALVPSYLGTGPRLSGARACFADAPACMPGFSTHEPSAPREFWAQTPPS